MLRVSKHACSRLALRCGLCLEPAQLLAALQYSEILYDAPNGAYRMIKYGGRFGVLVIRNSALVTALTLEAAFANCPQAVYYALFCRGWIGAAFNLRAAHAKGLLPEPHGTDPGNFKYPRTIAKTVWESFGQTRRPSESKEPVASKRLRRTVNTTRRS